VSVKRPDKAAVNKIFGGELPRSSSDERDPDGAIEDSERERWLRENVPPHSV
jgi:hypothetical protein